MTYAWQGFEDWQDPRSTGGTSGLAITADWLTRPLELKSDARYVVVVEKDGVFNRMVEDGFFDRQAKPLAIDCSKRNRRKINTAIQGWRLVF